MPASTRFCDGSIGYHRARAVCIIAAEIRCALEYQCSLKCHFSVTSVSNCWSLRTRERDDASELAPRATQLRHIFPLSWRACTDDAYGGTANY